MKQILASFLVALLLLSCGSHKGTTDLQAVRQPAEFETQAAIWPIWPVTDHKQGESIEKVTIAIIEALAREEQVIVTCKNKELLNQAKESLQRHFGELRNIEEV